MQETITLENGAASHVFHDTLDDVDSLDEHTLRVRMKILMRWAAKNDGRKLADAMRSITQSWPVVKAEE